MDTDRVLVILAVVVAILTVILGIYIWSQLDPPEVINFEIPYIGHVVDIGDTLWSIATRYRPNEDPRKVVWEIQRDNSISAIIHPGDIIRVRQPS